MTVRHEQATQDVARAAPVVVIVVVVIVVVVIVVVVVVIMVVVPALRMGVTMIMTTGHAWSSGSRRWWRGCPMACSAWWTASVTS